MSGVLEHLREDREHLLFQFTMLLVQLFEPLFGRGGSVAHALEEHVDQLVPCLDLGVMEETEQRDSSGAGHAGSRDITQVEASLRGKLCNLGVRNATEKGLRGNDRFQPREACRPLPQVFERRAARGVLIRVNSLRPAWTEMRASRRVFWASLRVAVIRI